MVVLCQQGAVVIIKKDGFAAIRYFCFRKEGVKILLEAVRLFEVEGCCDCECEHVFQCDDDVSCFSTTIDVGIPLFCLLTPTNSGGGEVR